MVPKRGLEPPRLAALDPKSSVSTNSTTSAHIFVFVKLVGALLKDQKLILFLYLLVKRIMKKIWIILIFFIRFIDNEILENF